MSIKNSTMSEQSFMSHSTHKRSVQGQVFPGNLLHWHQQPKNNQLVHTKFNTEKEQPHLHSIVLAHNTTWHRALHTVSKETIYKEYTTQF